MSDELDNFYRDCGLGARIGYGEFPALLIIDMQVAFNDASYRLGADQTAGVNAIRDLLPHAREAGAPVIYARTGYRADGRDGGVYVKKIPTLREVERGTPGYEFDPRIAPLPDDFVVEKRFPSAFFQTNLPTLLTTLRVDTIILTGASTSGCIRAAAIDGMSYGYRMIFPEECISDRAEGPHRANLIDMDAKYGDVVPVSDVKEYFARISSEGSRNTAEMARS